jgi:high-affinity iron transporter
MLNSFIIVLREGFEAFLVVAIMVAYLRKTGRKQLLPAVYAAVAASVIASLALGYVLRQGVNEALWEAVLGTIAVVLVATLVIHMWRNASKMGQQIKSGIDDAVADRSSWAAFAGVFFFALLMITREGMETALLMSQVHGNVLAGAALGLGGAGLLALGWAKFGHLINMKRFFQVTSIFLLLFLAQVAVYTFHEYAEAGLLPNSEALHEATEIWSPDGLYGKWFSMLIIVACAAWLVGAYLVDRFRSSNGNGGLPATAK